ncbi:unnamed protein product [Brassica oleracea]|uniref:(rape) hypothetical protein n=1 Tax=Brassica napus TaxID=3708 RepID=A0A816JUK4_BRANA|nr:unnamed protein product [Brassica napus]
MTKDQLDRSAYFSNLDVVVPNTYLNHTGYQVVVLERRNFVYSDPSSPFAGHADTRVDQRSLAKYVGGVSCIGTVYNKYTHSTQCLMATIRLDRYVTTPTTIRSITGVFDELAALLDKKLLGSDV